MAGKNKDASLNKRAFTSGFFFILAQLFARGLTFAVTPIYSRVMASDCLYDYVTLPLA